MLPLSFHQENRKNLFSRLPLGACAVVFAGKAPRQSADAYYPFFANRNFVYLTGMEEPELILLALRESDGVKETVFLRPEDAMAERWTGKRIHKPEAESVYGFTDIRYTPEFDTLLHNLLTGGHISSLWLDFDMESPAEAPNEARQLSEKATRAYPFLPQKNLNPALRDMRTVKAPCEIEAMRKAAVITGEGIRAMMHACRDGMKEYELKAEFDYALAKRGVLTPGFPSIICAGQNNFIIHYYDYTGTVHDGDMVLNDVGACWDNECNDVSRAWPANGKFNERQKLLYNCIYNTSEYMFSILKPGIPLNKIDDIAREYCFEQLKAIGLIEDYKDIRRLMWHNGAHHVGYDVHDCVNREGLTEPGNVFCVDIGVYCLDWGIGFRLEDNCLITENGCENLTGGIPRSIEEIEAAMAEK